MSKVVDGDGTRRCRRGVAVVVVVVVAVGWSGRRKKQTLVDSRSAVSQSYIKDSINLRIFIQSVGTYVGILYVSCRSGMINCGGHCLTLGFSLPMGKASVEPLFMD